jgi:hypothetical protein
VTGIPAQQAVGGSLARDHQTLRLSPNKVPESCQFLLEVNFRELTSSRLKTQQYWTLAMNAALTARQLECKRGACIKQIRHRVNRKIPSQKQLGVAAVEQQI